MNYYIKFEEEEDLHWLQNVIGRYIAKIKQDPSLHLHDDIGSILRIDESLKNPLEANEENGLDKLVVSEKSNNSPEKAVIKKKQAQRKYPKREAINICPDHTHYTAQRPPRTDCKTCWAAYKKYNTTAYDVAWRRKLRNDKKKKQNTNT